MEEDLRRSNEGGSVEMQLLDLADLRLPSASSLWQPMYNRLRRMVTDCSSVTACAFRLALCADHAGQCTTLQMVWVTGLST